MSIKTSINLWHHDVPQYGIYTTEECIEILKNAGYEAVDFPMCNWPEGDDIVFSEAFEEKVIAFAEQLRENGLIVGQTHLPYVPGYYPRKEEEGEEYFLEVFLPRVIRGIELTAKMGCKVAVFHLYLGKDREETLDVNRKTLDLLRPVCKRTGVKVALENVFGWNSREGICPCNVDTKEDMVDYVDYGGSEYFGICFDTGHAALLGYDPIEFIEACGKRLIALHVNSNTGRKWVDDLHMIPGSLNWTEPIKWEKISEALGKVGYSGTYNLEVLVPYGSNRNMVKTFVAYTGAVARNYADMI